MHAIAASTGAPTLGTGTTDTTTTTTTKRDRLVSLTRKAFHSHVIEQSLKQSSRATVQVLAVSTVLAAIVGYVLLRLVLVLALHTLATVYNVHVLVFSNDIIRVRVKVLGSNNFGCVKGVWRGTGAASDTVVGASYRLARWALPA